MFGISLNQIGGDSLAQVLRHLQYADRESALLPAGTKGPAVQIGGVCPLQIEQMALIRGITMTLTYSSYLKIDELLTLQQPLAEQKAHDEMLFIIIHQAYELWFKEILHELDHLQTLLAGCEFPRAQFPLKRVLAVLKVMIAQLEVLETMLPLDFLAFRNRLETASGFQSVQFRELEFSLGHKRRRIFEYLPEGSDARQRLERRYARPSVWDALLAGLAQNGYPVPEAALDRDVTQQIAPSLEVQALLIDIYAGSPQLVYLLELLLDLDQGFQDWRYRHVMMVERMIGQKYGTGGSAGVDYLKSTLFKPFFPDLWAIRTELQNR